jgi:hypothetical protein
MGGMATLRGHVVGALASNFMPARTMGMPPSPHPHSTASWPWGRALASNAIPNADAGHAAQAAWFGRRNLAIEAGAGHKQMERNGPADETGESLS